MTQLIQLGVLIVLELCYVADLGFFLFPCRHGSSFKKSETDPLTFNQKYYWIAAEPGWVGGWVGGQQRLSSSLCMYVYVRALRAVQPAEWALERAV